MMQIKIILKSSCEPSATKLFISNVGKGNNEVLLTIISPTGQQDIYVLLDQLKEAVSKID